MTQITLIVPYYRQPLMLAEHLRQWVGYSSLALHTFKFIIVDDGSPEPALGVVNDFLLHHRWNTQIDLRAYRVAQDIPWNRGGARNLGATEADTPWLLHLDTDHVLMPGCADQLAQDIASYDAAYWYRFRRFRVGAADDTRKKDDLADADEYGEIKPHIDSYLCTRELFWRTGGYDEDYSGCLGGGSPFLKRLSNTADMHLANSSTWLEVHTRHSIADASVNTLSRDTTEYARRKKGKEKAGQTRPTNPLRFAWERQI